MNTVGYVAVEPEADTMLRRAAGSGKERKCSRSTGSQGTSEAKRPDSDIHELADCQNAPVTPSREVEHRQTQSAAEERLKAISRVAAFLSFDPSLARGTQRKNARVRMSESLDVYEVRLRNVKKWALRNGLRGKQVLESVVSTVVLGNEVLKERRGPRGCLCPTDRSIHTLYSLHLLT